jgi:hypothetical protein
MRGNRGGTDGASLPLPWSTGGCHMAVRGVAAPARLGQRRLGRSRWEKTLGWAGAGPKGYCGLGRLW